MTNRKGFTMVELLIVLAIIAILAAVAIPVYSSQMEKSRIEVDNSNLRAATGLAAQDYILRNAGTAGNSTGSWHYLVFTLENFSNGNVKSQNMLVYPDNGVVDKNGQWHSNVGDAVGGLKPGVAAANKNGGAALTILDWGSINSRGGITRNRNGSDIMGRPSKLLELQQNGGNARFVIEIGTGGVVRKSLIETGNDKKMVIT